MEHYVLCEACGNGYTYTDEDVEKDLSNAKMNVLSATGQLFGVLTGNYGATIANQKNMKELKNFSRCPHCGSELVKEVSLEEFKRVLNSHGSAGVQINTNATVDTLLQRIDFMIEDGNWDMATTYCNQVLDQDPTNLSAYLSATYAETECKSLDEISKKNIDIRTTSHYNRLVQFATDDLKSIIERMNNVYDINKDKAEKKALYDSAKALINEDTDASLKEAIKIFEKIPDYYDADTLKDECHNKIQQRYEDRYNEALELMNSDSIPLVRKASTIFEEIRGYRDSAAKVNECKQNIAKIKSKDRKKNLKLIILIIVGLILAYVIITKAIYPIQERVELSNKYDKAVEAYKNGNYQKAIDLYYDLDEYDELVKIADKRYEDGNKALKDLNYSKASDSYEDAIAAFYAIADRNNLTEEQSSAYEDAENKSQFADFMDNYVINYNKFYVHEAVTTIKEIEFDDNEKELKNQKDKILKILLSFDGTYLGYIKDANGYKTKDTITIKDGMSSDGKIYAYLNNGKHEGGALEDAYVEEEDEEYDDIPIKLTKNGIAIEYNSEGSYSSTWHNYKRKR